MPNPEKSFDEFFYDATGLNASAVEAELKFRLDLARIQRAEQAELGYVFIDRKNHPDAVVVYPTPQLAAKAIEGCELIDELAQEEGSTGIYIIENPVAANFANREAIIT